MGQESLVVYVNGEYVSRDQAKISIFDVGFLRGDAVFDTSQRVHGLYWALPESGRDGTPVFPEGA